MTKDCVFSFRAFWFYISIYVSKFSNHINVWCWNLWMTFTYLAHMSNLFGSWHTQIWLQNIGCNLCHIQNEPAIAKEWCLYLIHWEWKMVAVNILECIFWLESYFILTQHCACSKGFKRQYVIADSVNGNNSIVQRRIYASPCLSELKSSLLFNDK